MRCQTNYYALYHNYNLPLPEAYYLAEYNYFITEDEQVLGEIKLLRKEICNGCGCHTSFDRIAINCCNSFMKQNGYICSSSNIYHPGCNIYKNNERSEEQKVRNTTDYYMLYKCKLISLAEAYVLAKSKQFFLCDNSMREVVFAIEDRIFEEICKDERYFYSIINEYQRKKPRKMINRDSSGRISIPIQIYMNNRHYSYDSLCGAYFLPIKNCSCSHSVG